MKKFPLTPQGVTDFQMQLYRQDDPGLLQEAVSAAADIVIWIVGHFEADVYILEGIRAVPPHLRLSIGWCLAANILGRQPLVLGDFMLRDGDRQPDRKNLAIKIVFCMAYDCCPGDFKTEGMFTALTPGNL